MEIKWNDKLVENQKAKNRQLNRMLAIVLPCFAVATIAAIVFYRRIGEADNARATGVVSGIAILVIIAIVKLWGTMMVRQVRAIPVIAVLSQGIWIGEKEIRRDEIVDIRIEKGRHRGGILVVVTTSGDTTSIHMPPHISMGMVKEVLDLR